MGVYEARLVPVMAEVLLGLGVKKALVVHGDDGMDEISLTGKTSIAEIRNGMVKRYTVAPEDFGFKRCVLEDLQCSSKEKSKEAAIGVLKGAVGAKTEIVCLNAGAALYAAEKAPSIHDGINMAKGVLDRGAALKKLDQMAGFSE